jgi:elongation factor Ts
MAEITAKLVNELRTKTGQGMMECKKMLTVTGGDVEKAIDEFRKKGIKTSLSERAATEGRVAGVVSADAKSGALVELNCNTDFTAKSAPFTQLAATAAKLLAANPGADVVGAAEVAAQVTHVSQTTGENVRIGQTAALSNPGGKIGMYLYGVTGKIGVLMSLNGEPSEELIKDLGMHITAKDPRPLGLTREDLPAALVARERDIAVDQAKATGKPQQIAEKIAEGKMASFYKDRVLLDQEFIRPDKFSGSVAEYLKKNNVTLLKYVRMEVGKAEK